MKKSYHIIPDPVGTFSFVGRVPAYLGNICPATRNDVAGGRAWINESDQLVTIKFPAFKSESEALDYAREREYNHNH